MLVYSYISPAMQNCWSMLEVNLGLVCKGLAVLVGWESKQTFVLTQLGLTSEHFSSWVATGRVRTSIFHISWLKSLTNVFKTVVKPLYFQLKASTSWQFAGTRIGKNGAELPNRLSVCRSESIFIAEIYCFVLWRKGMDLPLATKGGCSCLNYLQAALLMAKAYQVSIERLVTAAERFQIIFALNFATTDRQFPFFSLGKKDIFILLYCTATVTWISHSKNFAVRCCQQLLGCHPTTRADCIQVLMPNHV